MDGMKDLQDTLARIEREAPQVLSTITRDVAVEILRLAVLKAPVDTGHLRESGSVEIQGVTVAGSSGGVQATGQPPPATGTSVTARIGFNATTKDGKRSYAQIQHERIDFNHPKGGEAKYLEKALEEVADRVQGWMQRDWNAFIERFR